MIISKTDDIPYLIGDTIQLKNIDGLDKYDEPTRILIGPKEDASEGQAYKLRKKIEEYHEITNQILKNHDLPPTNLSIDFSKKNGSSQIWEVKTFYDAPLAAVVSILNKLKGDVINLEYEVLNQLVGEIDQGDIPIDTIVAKIIPSKRYVVVGEDYHSEIFLGAYSTTLSPEIEIAKENSKLEKINVVDGVGSYTYRPTHPGVYKYNGKITITDKQGKKKSYPFNSEFIAVQPAAVVSATAMNVLYKGLENPLSISVPGIEDTNVKASITGAGNQLIKLSSGKYKVILSNNSPKDVSITVNASLTDDQVKNMGSMSFRTKFLPKPYAKIGQINNNGTMKAKKLENMRGIIAKYSEDFVFNIPIKVQKFKVVILTSGENPKYFQYEGNKFPKKLRTQFGKLHPSDQVIFEDIRAHGKDNKTNILNPIIIKIIN